MTYAQQFLDALLAIFAESGLWLLVGFAAAGLLHAFVSKERLTRHLGRPGPASVFKATLVGVPLPLCSCSVIPAAASLRRGGASKGASAAFAVSTPEIDVPAASLTWALLGPVMALARIIAAAITAIVAGILIDATDKDKLQSEPEPKPEPAGRTLSLGLAQCCQNTPAPSPKAITLSDRLLAALRYGFITLPADLATWLTIGFVISAAVSAFVPASVFSAGLGSGIGAMLIAMTFGMVVYVCATGSTPMAAALVAKGLGPGPALVFLLTGPATNPATMAWILKDLGTKALAVYLVSIAGVALASGLTLEWLLRESVLPESASLHVHAEAGSPLFGAILIALLTYALVRKLQKRLAKKPAKACCATP